MALSHPCLKMKITLVFVFSITLLFAQKSNTKIDSLIVAAEHMQDVDSATASLEVIAEKSDEIHYENGYLRSKLVIIAKDFDAGRYARVLKEVGYIKDRLLNFNNNGRSTQLLTIEGNSYAALGFYDKGRASFEAAKIYAAKVDDKDERHSRLGMIHTALAVSSEKEKGLNDSELYYLKKAYTEFKQINKTSRYYDGFLLAANNLASYYIDLKKYTLAAQYLNEIALPVQQTKYAAINLMVCITRGDLYYNQGKFNTALKFYNRGLELAEIVKNEYQKKILYKNLANTYKNLKNITQQNFYLEKLAKTSDSLLLVDKVAVREPFETLIKERDQVQEKKRTSYISLIVIILSVLFLAVYAGLLFFGKYKKQRKITAEQARLIEDRMKLMDHAPKPSGESLDELKEVVSLAVTNDPSFFVRFRKYDPAFIERVLTIAPNTIATELEFCAFLRLNFETKEIARYTGLSVRSVESKKYRIRKKLMVPSEEDLNIWMVKL